EEYMKNKCNTTTCSNLEISESAFKRWLKNDNQFKRDYEKINLTMSTSDN
ncbi:endonuclease, partial [Bacillus thuringiensis]